MKKDKKKREPVPVFLTNAVTVADAKRPETGTHVQNRMDVEAAHEWSEENQK